MINRVYYVAVRRYNGAVHTYIYIHLCYCTIKLFLKIIKIQKYILKIPSIWVTHIYFLKKHFKISNYLLGNPLHLRQLSMNLSIFDSHLDD